MLHSRDIAALLEISRDEEPDEIPHAWCWDWSEAAEEYLQSQGLPVRPSTVGEYNIRAGHGLHRWVELENGTIVDGTVHQFCRDDIWILPTGHPLRSLYIYADPQGRALGSALRLQEHPLVANFNTLGGVSHFASS